MLQSGQYHSRPFKIALIGNYLPRQCGIATFTTDLLTALAEGNPSGECWAVVMNDVPEGYRYPAQVRFEVNQRMLSEYRLAADFLNMNRVEVVCLQHEYGIYGGENGAHVLDLLSSLRMPVVTTLHTVLQSPSNGQLTIVRRIAQLSDRLVVMSQKAGQILEQVYGVTASKISMIHHGIPDVPFVDPNYYKDQYGVEGRKVILTFGLLSPGKGIETMIDALPAVIAQHPEAVYIVLGATHPHVKKEQGEAYRLALQRRARELGVGEHLTNGFLHLRKITRWSVTSTRWSFPADGWTKETMSGFIMAARTNVSPWPQRMYRICWTGLRSTINRTGGYGVSPMKIAMLSPIAWRTPPRHYGPWETVVSLLTEGFVARGIDVTLFATGDSQTKGRLKSICPKGYEEDPGLLPKVWECLHIAEVFEQGDRFDLIHNHFDYLPLTYTGMTKTPVLTTIHGFSSPKILPVYKKYNARCFYVAISEADKSPELEYTAVIRHGIDLGRFTFRPDHGSYLLFFGRIHPEKGTAECVEVARRTGMKLILSGIIQDQAYFDTKVKPYLDDDCIVYAGSAGPEKRDELLGGAYALLHPIGFDEPFGLSVVESMACGTPVVAFCRGSMPEIIAHGETGFLTADIDGMVQALNHVGILDRRKCRRWVEAHFSVDRMVADYLQVYETIIGRIRRDNHRP